jgi:3-oxoacyl-[acyl-carrier-protein] synthase II
MSAPRVVVTGLGTTSPVGGDVPTTWTALLAGQSGVRPLKHDWADNLTTQIAAEVSVDPTDVLERVKARRLDRSGQLAMVAALEAGPTAAWGAKTPTSTRSGSASPWRPVSAVSRPC